LKVACPDAIAGKYEENDSGYVILTYLFLYLY
jgi:hypothetical protein